MANKSSSPSFSEHPHVTIGGVTDGAEPQDKIADMEQRKAEVLQEQQKHPSSHKRGRLMPEYMKQRDAKTQHIADEDAIEEVPAVMGVSEHATEEGDGLDQQVVVPLPPPPPPPPPTGVEDEYQHQEQQQQQDHHHLEMPDPLDTEALEAVGTLLDVFSSDGAIPDADPHLQDSAAARFTFLVRSKIFPALIAAGMANEAEMINKLVFMSRTTSVKITLHLSHMLGYAHTPWKTIAAMAISLRDHSDGKFRSIISFIRNNMAAAFYVMVTAVVFLAVAFGRRLFKWAQKRFISSGGKTGTAKTASSSTITGATAGSMSSYMDGGVSTAASNAAADIAAGAASSSTADFLSQLPLK